MSTSTLPTTFPPTNTSESPAAGGRRRSSISVRVATDPRRDRPEVPTAKVAALEEEGEELDEENASSEKPPERCSCRCVGRALVRDWRFLVAYLLPLILLPMPLILRENVCLSTMQIFH